MLAASAEPTGFHGLEGGSRAATGVESSNLGLAADQEDHFLMCNWGAGICLDLRRLDEVVGNGDAKRA